MGLDKKKKDDDYRFKTPSDLTWAQKLNCFIFDWAWRFFFHTLYWIDLFSVFWIPSYYVLGFLHKTGRMETKFMNWGYRPLTKEAEKKLEKIEPLIQKERKDHQNNIRLYEKSVSMCPVYGQPDAFKGWEYLEIACGHGGGIEWIQKTYGHIMKRIRGIDRVLVVGDNNPNLIEGDALNLPLPDSSMDIINCVEASHAVGRESKFFKELSRVLKPGGYFVMVDIRPEELMPMHWTTSKQGNFKEIAFEEIREEVLASRDEQLEDWQELYKGNYLTGSRLIFDFYWNTFWGAPGTPMYEKLKSGKWRYFAACYQNMKEK